MRILLNNKSTFIFSMIFIFLFFEKLYMSSGPTGKYNIILTPIIIILLLVRLFLKYGKEIFHFKKNIYFYLTLFLALLLTIHFFIVGGTLKEFLRYISLVIIIILASNFGRSHLVIWVSKLLIVSGFLFSLVDLYQNSGRATGFFVSSPTLFSYITLICIITLLYQRVNKVKFLYVFLILGSISIFLSESRSIILTLVFFVLIYFSQSFITINNSKIIRYSLYFIFICSFIAVLYLLVTNKVTLREYSMYSTNTRKAFIVNNLLNFIEDPMNILIGLGAGQSYLSNTVFSGVATPIHFDLLAVFIDYGIFGLLFMLFIPIILRLPWQILILLLVGSIHNLIFFPLGITLLLLSSNSIRKKVSEKDIKICLVGSSGGHLIQLYQLKDWWDKYERIWVTFNKEDSKSLLESELTYWCYYPTNRNIKNLIKNTFLAIKILFRERPNIIISTGAAPAIPFFYLGKLIGAKTIYIEVFDRIELPTLTGKIVYPVSDEFILQWDEQKKFYPKGEVYGGIL